MHHKASFSDLCAARNIQKPYTRESPSKMVTYVPPNRPSGSGSYYPPLYNNRAFLTGNSGNSGVRNDAYLKGSLPI